jgi:hypothetical protein
MFATLAKTVQSFTAKKRRNINSKTMEGTREKKPSQTLITLPNELLLHIISFLINSPESLTALMRTCRMLHRTTDPFLYYHVVLNCGSKAAAFAAALLNSDIRENESEGLLRARRRGVRSLHICAAWKGSRRLRVGDGTEEGMEEVTSCIHDMERLAELAIESPYCNEPGTKLGDQRWAVVLSDYTKLFEAAVLGTTLSRLKKCKPPCSYRL